ncbi:hypothetical protein L7F22_005877 [Adiantum nelumboides]|nr:hypothetical protein [Adiantum nelumboides]
MGHRLLLAGAAQGNDRGIDYRANEAATTGAAQGDGGGIGCRADGAATSGSDGCRAQQRNQPRVRNCAKERKSKL